MPTNTGQAGKKRAAIAMAAQAQPEMQATAPNRRKRGDWEFVWRFIAVALLFAVGWVIWIALQISRPPIALPAAYEAAARARASRNAEGQIKSAERAPVAAAAPAIVAPVPREPPVNVEKLKLSESIETAIPELPEESAKPRAQ